MVSTAILQAQVSVGEEQVLATSAPVQPKQSAALDLKMDSSHAARTILSLSTAAASPSAHSGPISSNSGVGIGKAAASNSLTPSSRNTHRQQSAGEKLQRR
jgi:hypothetical protein